MAAATQAHEVIIRSGHDNQLHEMCRASLANGQDNVK